MCDGRRAFINCTHDMLLKEFFLLLPAEKAVVEIQETVPLDEAVVAAWQQLQLKGYRIALDNFVLGDARAKLITYADYLKVEIRRVPQQHCAAIVAHFGAKCGLVAQKGLRPDCSLLQHRKTDSRCFKNISSIIRNACGHGIFPPTRPARYAC